MGEQTAGKRAGKSFNVWALSHSGLMGGIEKCGTRSGVHGGDGARERPLQGNGGYD